MNAQNTRSLWESEPATSVNAQNTRSLRERVTERKSTKQTCCWITDSLSHTTYVETNKINLYSPRPADLSLGTYLSQCGSPWKEGGGSYSPAAADRAGYCRRSREFCRNRLCLVLSSVRTKCLAKININHYNIKLMRFPWRSDIQAVRCVALTLYCCGLWPYEY